MTPVSALKTRWKWNGLRCTDAASVALLQSIQATPPGASTACDGWTAHDLVAHLAAGAKEIADLIEDKLEGRPDRPTRGFAEREAPMRALAHDELVERLVAENKRKLRGYDALQSAPGGLDFTGAVLEAERLSTHSRSEAAIHRWDLVGDDDVCRQLLSQAELTAHAAWVLDAMPVLDESGRSIAARAAAAGHTRAVIAFRSAGEPDVTLRLDATDARFDVVPEAESPDLIVGIRADQRLLVLWGRRPADLELDLIGDDELAASLDPILWPHAVAWR